MIPGVVAAQRFIAGPPAGNDPYWSSVGLYMRFNGANGSTSFVDEKGNAITRNGSPVISTADGFGGACGDFPVGAYLSGGVIPGISGLTKNTAWSIEVRAKVTWGGDRTAGLFCHSTELYSNTDSRFFIQKYGSKTYIYIAAAGETTGWYGEYTHIPGQFMSFQASCDGTTIRAFVDGVQITLASFDYSARHAPHAGLLIGAMADSPNPASANSLSGQIDELRVTKGFARNTTAYTPATDQFMNY